jgi:putrescine transport ATP-binding protein potG
MVTHDQEEAMTMATRIAIMSDGQLQQVGTPSDVYDYPNSRFTAEFIGETNIFGGVVIDDHADYAVIECEGLENHVRIDHGLGGPSEQDIWVSIRPEDIDLYKEKPDHLGSFNWAKGTVEEIAYLGSFAIYHIKLANGRVVKSQVPAPYWYVRNITPPTWDETVYISWPENQPTPLFR